MGSVFTNYSGNQALNRILQNPLWLALHNSLPPATSTGQLATEFAGRGYVRKRVHFTNPSGKSVVNQGRVVFADLPADSARFFGVWDAVSVGNMILIIDIDPNIGVSNGDSLTVHDGEIGVEL